MSDWDVTKETIEECYQEKSGKVIISELFVKCDIASCDAKAENNTEIPLGTNALLALHVCKGHAKQIIALTPKEILEDLRHKSSR